MVLKIVEVAMVAMVAVAAAVLAIRLLIWAIPVVSNTCGTHMEVIMPCYVSHILGEEK